VSVKIGVLICARMRMVEVNCDGKGSSENHHFLDVLDVYEVCRMTGVKAYITMEVHKI
jgi:hypothetical protein